MCVIYIVSVVFVAELAKVDFGGPALPGEGASLGG